MQNHKIAYLTLIWTLLAVVVNAQPDTTILTYQSYLDNVLAYHPIAKQAQLKIQGGEVAQLAARGGLDPALSADFQQKAFDSKLYYRHLQAQIKIPTRLGIDFVGGYENTTGVFLNPENNTDRLGLWNLGVEVNLLQGLFVNERRIALEQATVFQQLAANEQQILLNELLYSASYVYFEWQKYYYFESVILENIQLASTYFDNTKQAYLGGEKTAMDTLEAFIMLQDASNLLQYNLSSLIKSRQKVENFLWFEELPVALKFDTRPEDYLQQSLAIGEIENIQTLLASHPMLLEKRNKRNYFEIAQKLKREKLKPKLKAKYNPLLATTENSLAPNYSVADYKWGINFSMPLWFRKERAGVQEGEIKLQDIALDIENKTNELQNKIEASLAQQGVLQTQVNLMEQNVEGYKLLLDGENEKFRFGESSVFLLNKRQEKYINGQLKLIEIQIKQKQEILNYLYYTNEILDRVN
ncbi:MAG: TolC family protein [Saprospiraceae bacterium]